MLEMLFKIFLRLEFFFFSFAGLWLNLGYKASILDLSSALTQDAHLRKY